ncbi:MAG: carboxypeptidase-like regulatory domain-containing protein, partial [Gloeobacteraceae cyanobacterium ES-bin-316]|nr:carboxypeptidase-like regulatory domain-containing protein [Ferruginibacter sp.]
MLTRFYNIIFCLIFSATVCAQQNFAGRVLNEKDDTPLSGASIYINNTSIGSISNDKGEFFISNAISGDVIISSIGYERLVFKLNTKEAAGKWFVFKLAKKETMLTDVLILPDATRKRFLRLFTENFLGITEEADMSKITNLNAINFANPNEKYAIKAYSDTPLIIVNKKLGYTIKFELVDFYFNENTGQSSFYGYTRYEEMGDKKRWKKNREKAYYGSTLHFFRSLINNE